MIRSKIPVLLFPLLAGCDGELALAAVVVIGLIAVALLVGTFAVFKLFFAQSSSSSEDTDPPRPRNSREAGVVVDAVQKATNKAKDTTGRSPTSEQLEYVRASLHAHRQEYVLYCLRLEYVGRDMTDDQIDEVLQGQEPVLAAPVLDLHSGVTWLSGQRDRAISIVIEEFGMVTPPEFSAPIAQASEACRVSADGEAKRRCDAVLKGA